MSVIIAEQHVKIENLEIQEKIAEIVEDGESKGTFKIITVRIYSIILIQLKKKMFGVSIVNYILLPRNIVLTSYDLH